METLATIAAIIYTCFIGGFFLLLLVLLVATAGDHLHGHEEKEPDSPGMKKVGS